MKLARSQNTRNVCFCVHRDCVRACACIPTPSPHAHAALFACVCACVYAAFARTSARARSVRGVILAKQSNMAAASVQQRAANKTRVCAREYAAGSVCFVSPHLIHTCVQRARTCVLSCLRRQTGGRACCAELFQDFAELYN